MFKEMKRSSKFLFYLSITTRRIRESETFVYFYYKINLLYLTFCVLIIAFDRFCHFSHIILFISFIYFDIYRFKGILSIPSSISIISAQFTHSVVARESYN